MLVEQQVAVIIHQGCMLTVDTWWFIDQLSSVSVRQRGHQETLTLTAEVHWLPLWRSVIAVKESLAPAAQHVWWGFVYWVKLDDTLGISGLIDGTWKIWSTIIYLLQVAIRSSMLLLRFTMVYLSLVLTRMQLYLVGMMFAMKLGWRTVPYLFITGIGQPFSKLL